MTALPKRITSDFALLDVKMGRNVLFKAVGFNKRPSERPRIFVTIEAEIVNTWGDDDGVSREFELKVTSVKLKTGVSTDD